MRVRLIAAGLFVVALRSLAAGDDSKTLDTTQGDALLNDYFERQVAKIEAATFSGIESLEDWEAQRGEYRRQLAEMLGLDPMPERTPLEPVVTGTLDHDDFTVEKLHFQSSPGLYVTGNLYIPKGLTEPAPTMLYVCGHAQVKEDGVSFGGKASYQHHPEWFARHGYVCLIIDTLQLGEIEGLHHGTYREGMWWWQSRGYTPAGVEAWNGMRALDYLETRPEVDASRLGVTGRSGGGAYSWWIAALDERIKVAVPVAGIASLRNHLLGPYQTTPWALGETHGHDGCIEGHCDCMYFVNSYRWDFPMVAALVAPRALLISNTDKDSIFPLDGVYDVYRKTQRIYDLYGATDRLGLQICEGPHSDTQQLRVHAFQWINRHLKSDEPLIDVPAEKLLEPRDLRVLDELPADEINTAIHETFVPAAKEPPVPQTPEAWHAMRNAWKVTLEDKVFRGWPDEAHTPPLDVKQTFVGGVPFVQLRVYEFTSQDPYRLELYVLTQHPKDELNALTKLSVRVLDESTWPETVAMYRALFPEFKSDSGIKPISIKDTDAAMKKFHGHKFEQGIAYLVPRGVGPTAWTDNATERTHIRRRFALLGQTVDGMRAWDVRRGLQALRSLTEERQPTIHAQASGAAASWLLAASLFDEPVADMQLEDFASPESLAIFLNVERLLPPSALLTMAAERADVTISGNETDRWNFAAHITEQPWFSRQIQFEKP